MALVVNQGFTPGTGTRPITVIPRRHTQLTYKKLNIFALDVNPVIAASFANDMHVSKMTTESAQILSTVVRQVCRITEAQAEDIARQFPGTVHRPSIRYTLEVVKRTYGIDLLPTLYRPTHSNHPSVVWAKSGPAEYDWLYNYFIALGGQYEYRFGRVHESIEKLADVLRSNPFPEPTRTRTLVNGFTIISAAPSSEPSPIRVVASPDIINRYYRTFRGTGPVTPPQRPQRNLGGIFDDLDNLDAAAAMNQEPLIEHTWPNAVEMYREYYCVDKFPIGRWTNVPIPTWYKSFHEAKGAKEIVKTRKVRGRILETRLMEY